MRYFFIVLTVWGGALSARSQSATDSIRTVINNMFTAMRQADAAGLQQCFSDSIVFQTISRNKEGEMVVKTESPDGFLEQVGKSTPGSLDERIEFETIKVDGPLAIAWTPYRFFYNGAFSHCGVNSFQLVRFNGIWKIQYIIDTRRRQGCEVEN